MKYAHRYTISAPLAQVTAFHQRATSMAAITPPPVVIQMHASPEVITEGDEMEFTLWLLFLPIRWRARFESVTQSGFQDRQLDGPFHAWLHKHYFIPLSATETIVLDEIEAKLHPSWWKKLLGLGMWVSLPLLFTYRAWRTRQILSRQLFQSDI